MESLHTLTLDRPNAYAIVHVGSLLVQYPERYEAVDTTVVLDHDITFLAFGPRTRIS